MYQIHKFQNAFYSPNAIMRIRSIDVNFVCAIELLCVKATNSGEMVIVETVMVENNSWR